MKNPSLAPGKQIKLGPLTQDLPFLTRNLRALLRTQGAQLQQTLQIEPGVIGILNIVWLNPGISQNDLAASVVLKKSAVTRLLQSLEQQGLILRKRVKDDRRYNALSLTAEGEKTISRIRALTDSLHDKWFQGISETDRAVFFSVLTHLVEHMSSEDADAD